MTADAPTRLARWFDAAMCARAAEYVRERRVVVVKPPPWPVVARVRGDDGYVVTVHHAGGANRMYGECSCPAGGDCEHVAAAALAGIEAELAAGAGRSEAARQEVVAEWLTELGRLQPGAAGAAGRDAEGGGEKVIAYVLDVRDAEPGITIMQATRLARGGLGAGALIGALGDPQRGAPSWVEVADLRRIAMLRAVTRVAPQIARLPLGRVPSDLIEELAATGRLFWQTTRSTPLAYGPPRTATLAWHPLPDAPDLFRYGISAALVLAPARDTHYIDPDASTIGPLDLGPIPSDLVQRLIAGPPVPASMRGTVARSLAALVRTPDSAAEPVRPRLKVGLDRDAKHGAEIVMDAQAAYGDVVFGLGVWDPVRDHPRDLVVEGRYQARLRALVDELPHRGRPRSSVELLADARHIAEVMVPRLRVEGWRCVVDEDFPHEAPLEDVTFVEGLVPMAESRDWFAVELGVVVAGRTVSLLPLLLQAIRDGELLLDPGAATLSVGAGLNLRLPEGELIHVPAERLERWLRPLIELELRGAPGEDELRVPGFVAAAIDDDEPGRFAAPGALDGVREQLAALLDLAPRPEPAAFGGTLREYQRVGLAWLRALHDAGLGGLLADEMGLGKTVQLLAFLDELGAEGALGAGAPALVIAPRSVVGTWQREAERFAPRLRTHVHLGGERAHGVAGLTRHQVVITSYQTFVRDQALFAAMPWTTVIFDEAQALKNPDTQVRAAAATLAARSRFAITGTPIENHLGELWSQVDLAVPGILGRRRGFDATIRRPIEEHGALPPLEHLRRTIRPFLLRRTKDEVALELPPKTEIIESVELDTAQRDLYETLRLKLNDDVRAALTREGLHGSTMVILDALLKLRQCCCDPRLVKLPEARAVRGSAKLERLIARLEELADGGRSTLVFSQFTSMLALIERACADAGIATVKLTGATRDRDDVIRRFQAGEAPVALVSLKAGGVGINLTRADTVIHYDPWWNPAAEAQATDRAHRIGQERPVMVYKLVARGTLEEAILALQDDKRALTAAALRDGGVTHLAAEDLAALYRRVATGAILEA